MIGAVDHMVIRTPRLSAQTGLPDGGYGQGMKGRSIGDDGFTCVKDHASYELLTQITGQCPQTGKIPIFRAWLRP